MISRPHPLAFLAFLLAFAALGAAPQRAGLITALRGDVSIIRPGKKPRKPQIKEDIFEGDTLKTGARGRLQVCFEDDSIVSIGRKAELVITKYLYDPSAKKGAMKINIKEGFFRVLGGAVTRIAPENFETVAGTASIGIRGCSFGGQVVDGTAMIVFFGSNIGGTIDVTADGVSRLLTTPGDGLSVPPGGPPSMPSPMGRFGVRVLRGIRLSFRGAMFPRAGQGTSEGGLLGTVVDPTKTLDKKLPDLLPESDFTLNGFAIGQDRQTGWLYRNGSPELLQLQLTIDSDERLDTVVNGGMLVSVHSAANFVAARDDDGFLLPVLAFGFTNGTISDGVDLLGNTVVAVTGSAIDPAPEEKAAMNWGKWEMTTVDPNSIVRDSRTIRGLWIGTDLPQTDLDALRDENDNMILGGDFHGTYSGFAQCLKNGNTRFGGTSRYEVDFRSESFTGEFNFATDDGPTMRFSGNVNADGSVQGSCTSVTNETVISDESKIEGAIYDNAQAIGTSWNAKTTDNSYIGVGGATGTVTPSATTTTPASVGQ
ncbi:MAG: hypothetical protein HN380_21155 [Victivallales bacterium]|nr:hypothetical protein [Victivallales bacterium]